MSLAKSQNKSALISSTNCALSSCALCSLIGVEHEIGKIFKIPSNVRKFKELEFSMVRCLGCQSLYSLDEVDLDLFYASYPFRDHKLDIVTKIAYGQRLRLLLNAGMSKTQSILDYGCGNGMFLKFLSLKSYSSLAGYDPFIQQFSSNKVLKKQYDVVTAYDVIEHVADPKETFAELVSLVKPGGILLIGTPNAEVIDENRWERYMMELHQPYHRIILSQQMLERLGQHFQLDLFSISNRFYFDTLVPGINTRFMREYMLRCDNCIDSLLDGLSFGKLLENPSLFLYSFFGYFLSLKANMQLVFKRSL